MSRLFAFASWFFTCLGITLLGVSILVVPAEAFADAGSNCYSQCNGLTGSAYDGCIAGCCQSQCGGVTGSACYYNCACEACHLKYQGDPNGLSDCYKAVCGTDQNCLANCLANTNVDSPQCPKGGTCVKTNCSQYSGLAYLACVLFSGPCSGVCYDPPPCFCGPSNQLMIVCGCWYNLVVEGEN
jgi:hypothetical protein